METLICFVNAIVFGMLIPLTIRWIKLHYASYKLKINQRGPLDRMIEISSDDILNGVIRKRRKQTILIMDTSKQYDMKDLNDKPNDIPRITSTGISSIYNSFMNKGYSLYLIPNEDVHIALNSGLISNLSNYYLNDEVNKILSDEKLKEIKVKKQKEDAKKAIIENQRRQAEEQRKLKEKQIEDSIKI